MLNIKFYKLFDSLKSQEQKIKDIKDGVIYFSDCAIDAKLIYEYCEQREHHLRDEAIKAVKYCKKRVLEVSELYFYQRNEKRFRKELNVIKWHEVKDA